MKFKSGDFEDVPCLCGSRENKVRFTERGFNLVKCKECGLIFTNPRLKQDVINELYRIQAQETGTMTVLIGTKLDKRPFIRDADDRYKQLLDHISKNSPSNKILEIGVGKGKFLRMASQAGFDVQGFDIAEGRVETTNGVKITYAPSLIDAKYPDHSFDAIIMWEVFEHIPNPKEILAELKRILTKNGLLIIQCPNGEFALRKTFIFTKIVPFLAPYLINKQCGYCNPEFHLYFYSMKTLRDLLDECGFKTKDALVYRMYQEKSRVVWLLHELIYWQAKLVNFLSQGKSDNNVFLLVTATPKQEERK